MATFEQDVNRDVTVPLTQNQFDALVDFTYNLGEGNLKELAKNLNAGHYDTVPQEMKLYNHQDGIVIAGLVTRRSDEGNLFQSEGTANAAVAGASIGTPVVLTLFIHSGDANGPTIPGARILGKDGSGNSFQQTTNSNGYVIIKGDSGTWSFSASASGYAINNWDQDITETDTKQASLQKAPGTDQNAAVNSLLMGSQQGSQANTQENAANTYCSDHGGYIQEGACTFLDGSSCNAQDFLNGKCSHESQQYQQHNLAENCSNEGNDLLSHGKYNEAINAYEKAVEINPHYYPAWVEMGNALDEIGKHDEAVQAYNEAIEINPHCNAAWGNKGQVLYNQGKYNEAIECFDEETKIDPQNVIAWYFESLSLRELHRDTDADAAFAKAKELGYQPQPAVQPGDQQSYQPPESQSNGNGVADEEAARKQAMEVANDFQSEFGGTLDANKIQKLNQIFK